MLHVIFLAIISKIFLAVIFLNNIWGGGNYILENYEFGKKKDKTNLGKKTPHCLIYFLK